MQETSQYRPLTSLTLLDLKETYPTNEAVIERFLALTKEGQNKFWEFLNTNVDIDVAEDPFLSKLIRNTIQRYEDEADEKIYSPLAEALCIIGFFVLKELEKLKERRGAFIAEFLHHLISTPNILDEMAEDSRWHIIFRIPELFRMPELKVIELFLEFVPPEKLLLFFIKNLTTDTNKLMAFFTISPVFFELILNNWENPLQLLLAQNQISDEEHAMFLESLSTTKDTQKTHTVNPIQGECLYRNFADIDFRESKTDWPKITLAGVNLTGSTLNWSDVQRTLNPDKVILKGSTIHINTADLIKYPLCGKDLSYLTLVIEGDDDLRHINLTGTNLSGTFFHYPTVRVSWDQLQKTTHPDKIRYFFNLSDQDLRGKSFTNRNLSRVLFTNSNVGGADFSGAHLEYRRICEAVVDSNTCFYKTKIEMDPLEFEGNILHGAGYCERPFGQHANIGFAYIIPPKDQGAAEEHIPGLYQQALKVFENIIEEDKTKIDLFWKQLLKADGCLLHHDLPKTVRIFIKHCTPEQTAKFIRLLEKPYSGPDFAQGTREKKWEEPLRILKEKLEQPALASTLNN